MNIKFLVCSLIIFSIWTSLFAPFIAAQTPLKLNPIEQNGLQFSISEAAKVEKEKEKLKPPQIEKLSQTEADAIFRRLPLRSSFPFTRPRRAKPLQLTARPKKTARSRKPFLRRKTFIPISAVWK